MTVAVGKQFTRRGVHMKKICIKSFGLGVMAALGILLLMGAASGNRDTGKYQIAGSFDGVGDKFYIVNTTNGVVKDLSSDIESVDPRAHKHF